MITCVNSLEVGGALLFLIVQILMPNSIWRGHMTLTIKTKSICCKRILLSVSVYIFLRTTIPSQILKIKSDILMKLHRLKPTIWQICNTQKLKAPMWLLLKRKELIWLLQQLIRGIKTSLVFPKICKILSKPT